MAPLSSPEMYRLDRTVQESAVLVGVMLDSRATEESPLQELSGLAEAAGARVVGQLMQRRHTPDAATYLGKGKVEDLKKLVGSLHADLVIFDNDLSPAQTRNLENGLKVRVIDRTELILDIFANRARTHEAQLAVELAQLEYSMPRLKRMWTHLSRQTQGGVGLRGPGEKQLEVDRRLVERRISDLRAQLNTVYRRREREVASRRRHKTVSLVGYTNAGKSTLLNALTGSDVHVRDALFATLDTRTRRWQLPGWGPVLLSDTVGFIRNLPHHLIASFRATLQEARCADLLLHVADASSPHVSQQVSAAYDVLAELGIDQKDTLLVINKVDALPHRDRVASLLNRYPNAIPISARSGEGLDRLRYAASEMLGRQFLELDVRCDISNGRLMAFLAEHGEVLAEHFHDDAFVIVHCRLPQHWLGQIRRLGAEVQPHGNGQSNELLGAPEAGVEQSEGRFSRR